MQEDDVLSALVSGDPQNADKVKAIVSQLRSKGGLADLAQMSGDPALAPFGQNMNRQLQGNEVELGRNAMQNKADAIRQEQYQRMLDQGQGTLAETIRYHNMEDQERKDRLEQQKSMLVSPDQAQATVDKIARYQLPLPSRYSKGGQQIIDLLSEQHPDYDATLYDEKKKAQVGFGSGKQGDLIRSADVSIQHLDTADALSGNLHNTQYPVANSVINAWKTFKGSPDIKAFNTAKQIVSDEITKFIVGGGGALADRTTLQNELSAADNPVALKKVTDTLRTLMSGQLKGLQGQFVGANVGNIQDFQKKLQPRTLEALGMLDQGQQSALPGAMAAQGGPPAPGSGPPGGAVPGPQGGALAAPSGAPGAAPGAISPIEGTLRSQTGFQGNGQPAPAQSVVDTKGIVRTGRRGGKRIGQLADGTIVPLE